MATPLLTIAVPTYNRADCLELLLTTLLRELQGLEGRVAVVVGDNASTDRTPEVTAAFAAAWRDTVLVRHAQNLGMDGNFCGCAERVRTPYFWVVGDDDLPAPGAVRAVLSLLEREAPDLVYLDSRWLPDLKNMPASEPVGTLQAVALEPLAFARRVHVWTTYLSGMVVRSTPLLADPARLRRHAGTQLSQLAWVLEALGQGRRFVHVRTPCVFATEGNTGGYKVLQVFGRNFPEIVRAACPAAGRQGALAQAILRRTAIGYLPDLLWGLRAAKLGRFEHEDAAAVLRPQFGATIAFHCLLRPIGHAPRPVARAALAAAHLASRIVRAADRIAERWTRSAKPL
jgi:abequosyltransferase